MSFVLLQPQNLREQEKQVEKQTKISKQINKADGGVQCKMMVEPAEGEKMGQVFKSLQSCSFQADTSF